MPTNPVPPKEVAKRIIVSVELPGKLYYDLQTECSESHTSQSDVIRNALYFYIDRQKEIRDFFNRYPNFNAYTQRMEE